MAKKMGDTRKIIRSVFRLVLSNLKRVNDGPRALRRVVGGALLLIAVATIYLSLDIASFGAIPGFLIINYTESGSILHIVGLLTTLIGGLAITAGVIFVAFLIGSVGRSLFNTP